MTHATGTFDIAFGSEDVVHEVEGGPKLTHADGKQSFTGDIQGDGSVEWLMCYTPDGSATLVGLNRIEGTMGGRRGSFVVESTGDHDGSQSKGIWRVIEGSGTEDLAGLRGEGTWHAPGGPQGTYSLEYELA